MKTEYPKYTREQKLSCKLTDEQIREIPILYQQPGFTQKEIANLFGVGRTTVQRWLKTPEEIKMMDKMNHLLYGNRDKPEYRAKSRKRKLQLQGELHRAWERAYRKPLRARPEWKEQRRKIWQRYYKKNREKVLEASKNWALNNKDKRRAYEREWRKKNREKLCLQRRKRYLKNIEKMRRYQRKWQKTWREKNRERARQRLLSKT